MEGVKAKKMKTRKEIMVMNIESRMIPTNFEISKSFVRFPFVVYSCFNSGFGTIAAFVNKNVCLGVQGVV